jgi:hypothetical protein
MKKTHVSALVVLTSLMIVPATFGWYYGETRYYAAPVVVERVYTPPVVYCEPRVVERTSSFGNDWFSISSTRSSVVYDTYVERPCEQTVIYAPPVVVNSVYVEPRPYYNTTVVVRPDYRPRKTIVISHDRPDRRVIIRGGHGDRDRKVRIKIHD